MTRPLRIQYPGAFYYVTCTGNEGRPIFADDMDRRSFLDRLHLSLQTFKGHVHSYVLMENHFHLILETPLANLSELMRHFNVAYTVWYNHRHHRTGHLYHGRYKAILIEVDAYLAELSRDVHLDPIHVKAGAHMGAKEKLEYLRQYRWTSLHAFMEPGERQSFVSFDKVLHYFGGDNSVGRKSYWAYIKAGIAKGTQDIWGKVEGQLILGSKKFAQEIKEKFIQPTRQYREQPSAKSLGYYVEPQRILDVVVKNTGKSLDQIKPRGKWSPERGMAIELLYRHSRLNQKEIGKLMGQIDYSAVSQARKRFRTRLDKDCTLEQMFSSIEKELT